MGICLRMESVLEKNKNDLKDTSVSRPASSDAAGYQLVATLVDAINGHDDFALDPSKSFQVKNSNVSRKPITTDINEVVVNKVKITEAQEIVFKDTEAHSYSTRGKISYEPGAEVPGVSAEASTAYLQDTRKVEAERLTYLRKTIRNQNRYFFEVKNHEEFYQMGRSFHDDFKAGQKFFLFSHVFAGEAQQKTILGVASFLQYFDNVRVLVISSNLDQPFFKKILHNVESEELRISSKELKTARFSFHQGMTFVDGDSLMTRRASDSLSFEQIIEQLYNLFDCILFDLPNVKDDKAFMDFYFHVYKKADSVSLVFAKNASTFKEVSSTLHHFNSYNIKIKGALMAKEPGATSEK